ncbi:MAG: MarR family transcriptional regulator [Pseudomonadota bacterium]
MSDDNQERPDPALSVVFGFFNEIGIINQLSRAMFEARLPNGVTVAHFSVLNHLIRVRDGQTPMRLADAFQVPKTTMTHTLMGLEARALIDMRPNPDDGRSKRVWLTEAGREFRTDAIYLLAEDVQSMAEVIDFADLAAALPTLEAVRKYLDDARDLRPE